MICPMCGGQPLRQTSRYCHHCGAAFEPVVEPDSRPTGTDASVEPPHTADRPPAIEQSPAVPPVLTIPPPRISTTSSAAESHETESLRGVQGWLLLLCIYLVAVFPLAAAIRIPDYIDVWHMVYPGRPEWVPTVLIVGLIDLLLTTGAVVVGIGLWKGHRGAVKRSRIFLLVFLGSRLLFYATILANAQPQATDTARGSIWPYVLRSVGGPVCWYLYLSRSRRVEATFGTLSRPKIEQLNLLR